MTFLEKVAAEKKAAVDALKKRTPLAELKEKVDLDKGRRPFFETFSKRFPGEVKIIAEVKRASPSRGLLRSDLHVGKLAQAYEDGGASAISVITEERHFMGSLASIREAKKAAGLPVLRKDFIVDPYELYESKVCGADAVLLIGEMLERGRIEEYMGVAQELMLDVLFEVHGMRTYEKAEGLTGFILGVNNRNLETLDVDLQTGFRIIEEIPVDYPIIVESGIEGRRQIEAFMEKGVSGFLVGTSLVLSEDPAAKLREFRGL
ncbi:MAG: indole-3-glycerol phosphate synthase TrpC [Syntrophorhabdus aromaticivorans]|uniref:indole-3-glycerol-phosphate synthase n=1 Tax=Syntrophorhabdus aromaticivorans TaxID=328301 RepID=A0A971S0M4_9BACT|nr:indole-3-glycerol phosphate synthase TrpC [Syntrophorhabdus aromaticivorans]